VSLWAIAVVLGVVVGFTGSPAAAATRLDVASSMATYRAGQPVSLRFTVTNTGAVACRASQLDDGTLTITSMTRDGSPVSPTLVAVAYEESIAGTIVDDSSTLPPGGHLDLSVVSQTTSLLAGSPQSLRTVSWAPSDSTVMSLWPVNTPGTYQVSAVVGLPNLPGLPPGACRGLSGAATARFVVTSGRGHGWWLVVGLAIGGLALVVGMWLLLGRRHRQRTAGWVGMVVVLLGVFGSAQLALPRPAQATVVPQGKSAGMDKKYSECDGIFRSDAKSDPGGDAAKILATVVDNPDVTVNLRPIPKPSDNTPKRPSEIGGDGKHFDLDWGWWNTSPYRGNDTPPVNRDACASLYHELYHAYESVTGQLDFSYCNLTDVLQVMEVHATLAENRYRARRHPPLSQREFYDTWPLPKSTTDCIPPAKKPGPAVPITTPTKDQAHQVREFGLVSRGCPGMGQGAAEEGAGLG
jgi:hypothetical protein